MKTVALTAITQGRSCKNFQTMVHSDLIPAAEEVQSLHQEFGISFDRLPTKMALKEPSRSKQSKEPTLLQKEPTGPQKEATFPKSELQKRLTRIDVPAASAMGIEREQKSRQVTRRPLEHTNLEYVRLLEERAEQADVGEGPLARDFMHENQLQMKLLSMQNQARRIKREERLGKLSPIGRNSLFS